MASIGDREYRAPAQLGHASCQQTTDHKLKLSFDANAFLATVGVGISIKQYLKNELIFDQGDDAET
ncbi:MAG: hypothetical protein ABI407_04435, partial [Bradyrhizobium sp.]